MSLEIRQRQCCIIRTQFKLRANEMKLSTLSPDQSMLSFLTSAQLLRGRSAADLSPAYAAPLSLVLYTNRPSGHQRMCTKRLTVR